MTAAAAAVSDQKTIKAPYFYLQDRLLKTAIIFGTKLLHFLDILIFIPIIV